MIQNTKTIKAGEMLISQGEEGKSAYIIETGRVEIFVGDPDKDIQILGTRGPGTIIGEMALIDNAPRTASIRAIEDCKLIEITNEDFAERLKQSDSVMEVVMRVLMTRYRDTLARSVIVHESHDDPATEDIERSIMELTDTLSDLRMENEFRAAMENGQLSLHYQPIVSLETGGISGFEALMRWIHPEEGFISPAVFITMAERTDLIVEASKWALKTSCAFLNELNKLDLVNPIEYMSVNFSAKDLAQHDFLENALSILAEYEISPEQIQLEITESLLMLQPEKAQFTLEKCREAGFKIAIDDFGTGYSSLSYLHKYPISTLKIDQSFVRDIAKKKYSLELSKSIISLGKGLDMKIIAEGVEDIEEAEILRKLNCEAAQGYYFSKPLPDKDILALLSEKGDFSKELNR